MGRRICILCDQDFQDLEVLYPYYRLLEAGHEAVLAGPREELTGKYGYPIRCTADIREASAEDFDGVLVPGGWAPDFMRREPYAAKLVAETDRQGKLVAVICHGGWVLASARILQGRKMTGFYAIRDDLENAGAAWVDESVVTDGNLISSRHPDDLPAFMKAILYWLEDRP